MTTKLRAALAAALVALLAACGSSGGANQVQGKSGELRLGMEFMTTTLDPDLLPIQQDWTYLDPIYDSLTRLDAKRNVLPQLATSWTPGSDSGGYYLDMTLRTGLKFPDGAPFDADSVVANIHRAATLQGSTNAPFFAGVKVTKIDASHVRFQSPAGVGELPVLLAGPAGMMISQQAIAKHTDLSKTADGIGPYTLKSLEPNRIVYTKNTKYWDPKQSGAATVELDYLPDEARLNAVLAGNLDISTLPYQTAPTAQKAGYKLQTRPGNLNLAYAINSTIKPFNDIRVREAVSLAIDRVAFCKDVWKGHCTPSGQFFGAGTPFADQSVGLSKSPFDLQKAKQLIAAAGAKGAKFDILTVAGIQVQTDLTTYVQQQLTSIGLKPKMAPLAPAQVVQRFIVDKNAAMTIGGGGLAFDPSTEVIRYLLPNGLYNIGHVADPKLVSLAAQGLKETDQAKRNAIYQQISTLVTDQWLVIPIVTEQETFVVSPHVKGWQLPWGQTFISLRGVSSS